MAAPLLDQRDLEFMLLVPDQARPTLLMSLDDTTYDMAADWF